jgi:hypothetical protein
MQDWRNPITFRDNNIIDTTADPNSTREAWKDSSYISLGLSRKKWFIYIYIEYTGRTNDKREYIIRVKL